MLASSKGGNPRQWLRFGLPAAADFGRIWKSMSLASLKR